MQPSLIRTEADETTYNLHIVLRFELELALIEGTLTVDDLPAAWDEGMQRLLGVEVPGPADGVLQDVHWSVGLLGYFPTYTLGNLIGVPALGAPASRTSPDVDELLERGDFAPVREWLREQRAPPRPQVPAARAAAPRDRRGRSAWSRSCATCARSWPTPASSRRHRLTRTSVPLSIIGAVLCPVPIFSSSPAPASTT